MCKTKYHAVKCGHENFCYAADESVQLMPKEFKVLQEIDDQL